MSKENQGETSIVVDDFDENNPLLRKQSEEEKSQGGVVHLNGKLSLMVHSDEDLVGTVGALDMHLCVSREVFASMSPKDIEEFVRDRVTREMNTIWGAIRQTVKKAQERERLGVL